MNIVWSHAVDVFKQHGQLWYAGAQKFPIDIYKDLLLLHEFAQYIRDISMSNDGQIALKYIVLERDQAYHRKDFDSEHYGPLIEMMYRRRIPNDYIKSLLQSALLDTTTIRYHIYDELKVYIHGVAEVIGVMMCEIIGCAPPGHPYGQAVGEGLWLIHMVLGLVSDYRHIPQSDLDTYGVVVSDIDRARITRRINEKMCNMIKHYVDQHEILCTYGIGGIGYLNPIGHEGVLLTIEHYEQLVILIKKYNYNIFHPRFAATLGGKIGGYFLYGISYFSGNKL